MYHTRILKRELSSSLQVVMVMALGSVLSSTCTFILLSPSLAEHGYHEIRSLARERLHAQHETYHKEESLQADKLATEVRVLCLVMTVESNHEKKAVHLKNTWGRKCNKLIFASTKDDPLLGAIDVGVQDVRKQQWGKAKKALKYVFDHNFHIFDWLLVASEDSYVIMENLRYMLSAHDPESPVFGLQSQVATKQGSVSRDAGYVLSRSALKKFVTEAMPENENCSGRLEGYEETEIGKCLENVGVKAVDSRDSLGRGRFFPLRPEALLGGKMPQWYKDKTYHIPGAGLNCCSDMAISFSNIPGKRMYEYEYFFYHVRPYGIHHKNPAPEDMPSKRAR
ncbi:glycoprotein-N-acetylgalactosamine 3-beta-galactosyltransferase 1-like [Penaeus japonicus]|uniref:glycoprotein-N-acetylgalactosamine 3-beta-galactosyltransferase 1-like n=1 Tax=Penaeus japonicus TaxID=27405 RepID=UPI001C70D6F0|nr:glycoprotein-N-acetylgalactosamine 3-beta-galactosyltransferase 1-like [Penaeus japonicus]